MTDSKADTAATIVDHGPRKLDDVLLAMDVVDTLRHRDQILLKEMDASGRKEQLIERLKEIYVAQGIDVPDHVLKEGVKALEEQRFLYKPPKPSIGVRLAKLYVSRDKWLKPVAAAVAALVLGAGAYQFGVVQPAQARAAAEVTLLSETLPNELAQLRQTIQAMTEEDLADRLAESYYQNGVAAAASGDAKAATAARDSLIQLRADLGATYDVRVVYGPGEPRSGVFRIPDDAPLTRNYYLIVEAVDPAGSPVTVPVISEEDGATKRVSKWGQRVSEAAFNQIAADKQDDQIIQNARIGQKDAGRLTPEYDIATPGGAILEW